MPTLKDRIKHHPFVFRMWKKLNTQFVRDEFVRENIDFLAKGSKLLDAGCGSQRYRSFCDDVQYFAQDFGAYVNDDKKILSGQTVGGDTGYAYGKLDYVGNIWQIEEEDGTFDAILCTEVLEHIPYPNETIKEFHRLLVDGGRLILTAPTNCLRHMDPYFFYSGFSDRYYQKLLTQAGFANYTITAVGDYYAWFASELWRHISYKGWLRSIHLVPAFAYYLLKRETQQSVDTLCFGYHVVATK